MPKQYPKDFRDRAVRLVMEAADDHHRQWAAIRLIAPRLGVSAEALRRWVRQAEVNAGIRPGVSESENAEIHRLRKEVAELRRTNDILRTASAFFAGGVSTAWRLDDQMCEGIS
jgi:transposase